MYEKKNTKSEILFCRSDVRNYADVFFAHIQLLVNILGTIIILHFLEKNKKKRRNSTGKNGSKIDFPKKKTFVILFEPRYSDCPTMDAIRSN